MSNPAKPSVDNYKAAKTPDLLDSEDIIASQYTEDDTISGDISPAKYDISGQNV